jgi:hypothetical protein
MRYNSDWFCLLASFSYSGQGEQRAAHFRSMSPSHAQSQSAQPQTGLGILMNGGSSPGPSHSAPTLLAPNIQRSPGSGQNYHFANLPPDQRVRVQEDLADRERQASALAAAGHVAESVNFTKPSIMGQVLQAPPPLVGMPPPSQPHGEEGQIPMEGINWNELGGNVDDIDMDFAAMFDPEQELSFMQEASLQGSQPPSSPGAPPGINSENHGTPNPLNATSA